MCLPSINRKQACVAVWDAVFGSLECLCRCLDCRFSWCGPAIFTGFKDPPYTPPIASPRIPLHGSQLQQRFAMALIASPLAVSPSAASTLVSALSASTIPTSVKSKPDNDPQTVRFTNVQDLFDVINSTTGDFLTVTSIVLPFCFYIVY